LRLPATPVATSTLIRHEDLTIKEHNLQSIQQDHERFVNRNMQFSVQLEQFHELQMDTLQEITYRLKVRGGLETAEVRELQFLIDDARTSIGYVIEKSVTVVQAADQLIRKVLHIEQIPEQVDLSLGVPVTTKIPVICQHIGRGAINVDTTPGQPLLRLRGGGPRKRRADPHFTPHRERSSVRTSGQPEIPPDFLGRAVHPYLRAPGRVGSTVSPAWMTEAAYDMDTWEIREFPYADWLSREDRALLKGTMPSTFSGSIRYNLVLRRLNRDNGMPILEGHPLGFAGDDTRQAIHQEISEGVIMRELSLLDQCTFLSETGLKAGMGGVDNHVILHSRELLTRKAPFIHESVQTDMDQSAAMDTTGFSIQNQMLRFIDPMSIPVGYIAWAYLDMCRDLGCTVHMRGPIHDIFGWWVTEALEFTPRYERVTKAYYRAVQVSMMIGYGDCPYVVRDIIHVRDVSLFSVVMKGLTEVEGDYVDCMDWTKEGTPYNLQVIPQYIHREYVQNAERLHLDSQNGRHIMRWWNARRAMRDGPFMHAMEQLVAALEEWKLSQLHMVGLAVNHTETSTGSNNDEVQVYQTC